MTNNEFTINDTWRRRPLDVRVVLLDHKTKQTLYVLYKNNREVYCSIDLDGRILTDDYHGESPLEDAFITAGVLKVVGFADDEYGYEHVEVKFDEKWLDTLPIYHALNEGQSESDNLIEVGYEKQYRKLIPVARVKQGEWTFRVNEFLPGEWDVCASNETDSDKFFSVHPDKPLFEAWLEAMRRKKAMDEFVDEGKRIAEKYGVSFVHDLIQPVASGYWYLEG